MLLNDLEEYQLTQPERILCAAILYNGVVISGYRHGDCCNILRILLGLKDDELPDRENQGFLTSYNRYVNRVEAWKIAKINNQVKFGPSSGDDCELISENLY